MKKMRRFLAVLLAFIMVCSNSTLINATTTTSRQDDVVEVEEGSEGWGLKAPNKTESTTSNGQIVTDVTVDSIEKNTELDLKKNRGEEELRMEESDLYQPDEIVDVIIIMEEEGLLEKGVSVDKLTGSRAKSMEASIISKIETLENRIEKNVLGGSELEVTYTYTVAACGMAVKVPYESIAKIKEMKGVKTAFLSPVYTIDPMLESSGDMIGVSDAWNTAGYTGSGMRVSVIDTGIDLKHDAFQATEEFVEELTETSLTKAEIVSVEDQLNAKKIYKKFQVDTIYRSEKIPFAFNYVDKGSRVDHNDTQSDHGTHVAGIVAANEVDGQSAVGVAKDAQLIIMKVFGYNGGAYFSDILAALEDSLILNVDVVNMSLGSTAGFSSEDPEIDEIYARVAATDVILAVAAGNEYSSAYGNLTGEDKPLTSNPDNGNIGSPSTYIGATSVASVNNTNVFASYFSIGDQKFQYNDTASVNKFAGLYTEGGSNEFDYVIASGYGETVEDFGDVRGKVAVVSRGSIPFTEKQANARAAGAIACIVYNNTSGSFSMQITEGSIPCISITREAGQMMIDSATSEGVGQLSITGQIVSFPSPEANTMSAFSCWGVTPSLELKPELAAPGGNIYSTRNNNTYGVMSGTSMASPQVAGAAALLIQSIRDKYKNFTEEQVYLLANSLLMSTAIPVKEEDGIEYSPRKQGAGMMNIYNAIMTSTYLTVENEDKPKVHLGDDKEKTGVYQFSFDANNLTNEDSYYTLDTSVLTESYYSKYGMTFMAEQSKELGAKVSYASTHQVYVYDFNEDGKVDEEDAKTLLKVVNKTATLTTRHMLVADMNGDEAITAADVQLFLQAIHNENKDIDVTQTELVVPANGTVTVDVTITLSKEDKAYMDEIFEYGVYVDGFVYLNSKNDDAINLTIPFLGFYGDWTEAPIFDSAQWYEDINDTNATTYYNAPFISSYYTTMLLGVNPYVADDVYLADRNALSPNQDGEADYIEDFYLSMLRSAKEVSFTYEDANTQEVYYSWAAEYVRKSLYNSSYDVIYPFTFYRYMQDESEMYYLTDQDGKYLEDGTKLNLKIEATLDFDGDSTNKNSTMEIPITIDTKAPQLNEDTIRMTYDSVEQKNYLTIEFTDEQYAAAVVFLDKTGSSVLSMNAVNQMIAGETQTITYDVTGYGNQFTLILTDYAVNESYYMIEYVSESGEDNYKELDPSLLYGYRLYEGASSVYGWGSFDLSNVTENASGSPYVSITKETIETKNQSIYAGEYVSGYLIGIDMNKVLYAIHPGSWDRFEIATLDTMIYDMAFDYSTGQLYAIDASGRLVIISPITGEVTTVGTISAPNTYGLYPLTIACTTDGQLYVGTARDLYQVDKTNGQATLFSKHNLSATATQSMMYDHVDQKLYWALNTYYNGMLYEVDLESGDFISIATLGSEAQLSSLFRVYSDGINYLEHPDAMKVTLNQSNIKNIVGTTQQLKAVVGPWTATNTDVLWSSSDPSILTVDGEGRYTGIKEGTATITVTTVDGGFTATCEVEVFQVQATLHGFRLTADDSEHDWIQFDVTNPQNPTVVIETADDLIGWYCGEYYNGYVYGYDVYGKFFRLNLETKEVVQIKDTFDNYTMVDMAYNYVDGNMYVLYKHNSEVYPALGLVDLSTGNIQKIGTISSSQSNFMVGLACDNEGFFYSVDAYGTLVKTTVVERYGNKYVQCEEIGNTGFDVYYVQSMAIDPDTNELYWAQCHYTADGDKSDWNLVWLDKNTAIGIPLGSIGSGAEVTAMFAIPKEVVGPEVPVTGITMESELDLIEGMTGYLGASVQPISASNKMVTYEVADTSIAVVDQGGKVTGIQAGTTTVTATVEGDETTFTATTVIRVTESAGFLNAYFNVERTTYAMNFWGTFSDIAPYSIGVVGEDLDDIEVEYRAYAAEYYNGFLYAIGMDLETSKDYLYKIDPDTLEAEVVASINGTISDMAFDYATGSMMAIQVLSDKSNLISINLTTGKMSTISRFDTVLRGLACDSDGTKYGVGADGFYYIISKSGELTKVGSESMNIGTTDTRYMAMTYDHVTGNLYLAGDKLYLVNKVTGKTSNLGYIGLGGSQITALYIVPSTIPTIPDEILPTAIELSKDNLVVFQGESSELTAEVIPVSDYVSRDVVWSVEDETIATVDEHGVVTGVTLGTTIVTASTPDQKVSASATVCVVDKNQLAYGFDTTIGDLGWVSFSPYAPDSMFPITKNERFEVIAAEYYDGMVYGYELGGAFFKADPENLSNRMYYETKTPDDRVLDMAYDYSTDTMYVTTTNTSTYDGYQHIYTVDLETGEMTLVSRILNVRIVAIACATDGTLYGYNSNTSRFVKINIEEGSVEDLGNRVSQNISGTTFSMTYDHSAGELYFTGKEQDSTTYERVDKFFLVDVSNGTIEDLGTTGLTLTGIFIPYTK